MTTDHVFSTRRGQRVRAAYRREHPLCEPCQRRGRIATLDEMHPLWAGGAPHTRITWSRAAPLSKAGAQRPTRA
jgi:hypothetical protein